MNAACVYSSDVNKPSKPSFAKGFVQAVHVGLLQHLGVRDLVLSLDLQYASQAPHVEAVEFLLMPRIGGSRLASVEEGTENAGLVDALSSLLSESGVVPYTLAQFGHYCDCHGDPSVDLRVDGHRAGDGGPEVREVLNYLYSASVDGDAR